MPLFSAAGRQPAVSPSAWIAPTATLVGDVRVAYRELARRHAAGVGPVGMPPGAGSAAAGVPPGTGAGAAGAGR